MLNGLRLAHYISFANIPESSYWYGTFKENFKEIIRIFLFLRNHLKYI